MHVNHIDIILICYSSKQLIFLLSNWNEKFVFWIWEENLMRMCDTNKSTKQGAILKQIRLTFLILFSIFMMANLCRKQKRKTSITCTEMGLIISGWANMYYAVRRCIVSLWLFFLFSERASPLAFASFVRSRPPSQSLQTIN